MKHALFLFFAAGIVFTSCQEAPEACLTSDKTRVQLGEEVTFTNCSQNQEGAKIIYGDGDEITGSKDTYVHSFGKPGDFDVVLEVSDHYGERKDEASVSINVAAPEKSQLQGKWTLLRIQNGAGIQIDPSVVTVKDAGLGEEMTIDDDNIKSGSQEWDYSLDDSGKIKIEDESFQVVKLFEGELILEKPFDTSYGKMDVQFVYKKN